MNIKIVALNIDRVTEEKTIKKTCFSTCGLNRVMAVVYLLIARQKYSTEIR